MYPFNNTPGLVNPPVQKKALSGQALVDKCEDDFSEYVSACNKGYCKADPAIQQELRSKLTEARAALKASASKV